MNQDVKNFYSESSGNEYNKGHFYKVVALHETPFLDWEFLSKEMPFLPRGWFELARLSSEDRIEFTRDFWLNKLLPLSQSPEKIEKFLSQFFAELDEISIYATQQSYEAPFDVHMVYSFIGDRSFFHGYPPSKKESIIQLQRHFANIHFPKDYLAFLEIHDGFSKYTDTGMIKIREMSKTFLKFQQRLALQDHIIPGQKQLLNPQSLIPFYESFGLHCYQCFYSDWYPEDEMGNIYYADDDSLIDINSPTALEDTLSFSTFIDWLIFYLEDVAG